MGALEKLRKREPKLDPGDLVPRTRRFLYGQDEDGGTQASFVLKDSEGVASKIPAGSIITKITTVVTEAFASGGSATIALGYTGATTAYLAATAYNNAALTGNDVQLSPAAAPIGPLAADRDFVVTVGTADLTDGKMFVDVEYLPPHQGGAR